MEKDGQDRTDDSPASCSQAEKRPLNNNILINAPLPRSMTTASNRWRDYWELEGEVTELGPSWPQPSHLSLSASAVWGGSAEAQLIPSHTGSGGWRTLHRKPPPKEGIHTICLKALIWIDITHPVCLTFSFIWNEIQVSVQQFVKIINCAKNL